MSKFDEKAAEKFWSNRVSQTNPLSAVLTYNAPDIINQTYDLWEKESLKKLTGNNLKNKYALDIGSGIGRISLLLASLKAEVFSVDISSKMLDYLTKRAIKQKVRRKIHTIRAASHRLDSVDITQSFDIITCFGLLEHLPPVQRRKTMEHIFRIAHKKTKIFIVVNNRNSIFLKDHKPSKELTGYHNYLVGLEWLRTICDKNKVKLKVRASNPNYAYLHYYLLKNSKNSKFTESALNKLARLSLINDLAQSMPMELTEQMASHFMVELSK